MRPCCSRKSAVNSLQLLKCKVSTWSSVNGGVVKDKTVKRPPHSMSPVEALSIAIINKIANWIFCIQLRSLRMINCCPLSSNSIRSRRIWRAMPAVPPQCSRDGSKHRYATLYLDSDISGPITSSRWKALSVLSKMFWALTRRDVKERDYNDMTVLALMLVT